MSKLQLWLVVVVAYTCALVITLIVIWKASHDLELAMLICSVAITRLG